MTWLKSESQSDTSICFIFLQ